MSLAYTVPTPGSTLNSVADPDIASALNTILTWANGNIAGADLSPSAAIALTQLAQGVARPTYRFRALPYTAADGDFVEASGTGTVTLPAAAGANRVVMVQNYGGGAVTVAATGTDTIVLSGGVSKSSLLLGANNAFVRLYSDGGSSWFICGGRPDSGWVANAGTNPAPGLIRLLADEAFGVIPMVPGAGATSYENGTVNHGFTTAPTYLSMWAGGPSTGAPLSVVQGATITTTAFTPLLIAAAAMGAGTYNVYWHARL